MSKVQTNALFQNYKNWDMNSRIKQIISLRFSNFWMFGILMFFVFPITSVSAQVNEGFLVPAKIVDGDTIPYITLPEVTVFSFKPFKNAKDEQRTKRLINNVKKVYPYAKLAAAKIKYYDQLAQNASSKSERDKINKKAETDIKAQFEADIKTMTRTQGKLLIKLIDRETGKTSYDIIKLSRGAFKAIFWQSMSSFFGMDLKEKYDKDGDDATVETIVQLIDKGIL
ncbi:MAG: DUF4294 domain-containing protein [Bacteroidota bacterium]